MIDYIYMALESIGLFFLYIIKKVLFVSLLAIFIAFLILLFIVVVLSIMILELFFWYCKIKPKDLTDKVECVPLKGFSK